MCVGAIVTLVCDRCGETQDIRSFLGCPTDGHHCEGSDSREDSIIGRSTHIDPCAKHTEPAAPSYYYVGKNSAHTAAWCEYVHTSLEPFLEGMSSLSDRVCALKQSQANMSFQDNFLLVMHECNHYLGWAEDKNNRAIEVETALSEVLNVTGVTNEINAVNVQDMTNEMLEMFNGYLSALTERLEELEAEQSDASTTSS
ncbi:hypothetical protein AUEXF2481DRAFT_7621 [Aureobasidium subglaciale EXF-2481]|uniref:Uncharacterized protein n=1 Tax=Aureobasidium subglaciale (strain EXF-2481) TaxID=1043005 RepID=A0A074Y4A7_AURSE|nr:uncharacterized protein AUEXF2481DRAFT_7621 [Aureobasidium subglaciale EXF-2481]KAI5197069.1 hypothetical protein E4T38_08201 [Aureobasidium subglaciale]KAI5215789.1 hypothetical protein E4T40_08211 [Aureobasidium subglaciale]KAI5219032.1 hypothetical protein E4T41_08126 [Aureobasidium subglaciale]KAI5256618.1 hypothetical protein E4T46_08102 [Aureobasidium subglaciale]KEQ92545.1 hypothetical protein AUEXF2481DRAFT_7621 [Aureobasidium subglaciale EXF-2481]